MLQQQMDLLRIGWPSICRGLRPMRTDNIVLGPLVTLFAKTIFGLFWTSITQSEDGRMGTARTARTPTIFRFLIN